MNLTKADLRVLKWFSGYLAGGEAGKISPTIGKLARHGLLERYGKKIYITGLGWHALILNGHQPQDSDGRTLEEILKGKLK